MKTHSVAALLSILILALCTPAWAETINSVKINPNAVDYPLSRSTPYISETGDRYEMSFGVRRWLRPLRMVQDLMHEETVKESVNWFNQYGGYGVMGHGEDVFTRQGVAFRRQHRGR
jgi:hypothetical protein